MRPDQDGGGHDRRAEGPGADLVDTDDVATALAPEGVLDAQVGLSGWHAAILAPLMPPDDGPAAARDDEVAARGPDGVEPTGPSAGRAEGV